MQSTSQQHLCYVKFSIIIVLYVMYYILYLFVLINLHLFGPVVAVGMFESKPILIFILNVLYLPSKHNLLNTVSTAAPACK